MKLLLANKPFVSQTDINPTTPTSYKGIYIQLIIIPQNVFYFKNEWKYAKGPNNANLENISTLLKLCNWVVYPYGCYLESLYEFYYHKMCSIKLEI